MIRLRVFLSRLLDLVLGRRRVRQMDEEIAAHLAALTEHYESQGMSPDDAAFAARRAFGGVDRIRMLHREQRGLPALQSLVTDVRAAAHALVRDRAFTAGLVVVLALGLAVNTTIFTIVNGMTWRTLPVPGGERIVHISSQRLQGDRQGMYTSYADYRDWRAAARTLSDMAAYVSSAMNIGDDHNPADRLAGVYVSANAFRVLRVQPMLGRDFVDEDERIGAPAVALLAHHIWHAKYAADPSVVGRVVRINGEPVTIIGVMPPGFQFPLRADVWQPVGRMPAFDSVDRQQRRFDIVARMADTSTLEAARAEMSAIAAATAEQHPTSNAGVGVRTDLFTHAFVAPPPQAREPLVMMIAAAIVLLIACANGASLLLARGHQRAREMAMRATLGASRMRIVRHLLFEALLMSLAAAVLGMVMSTAAVRLFANETVDLNLPYWIAFEFDARVFTYVAIVCLGTAVAFGLLPAVQLSRSDPHDILKDGGRGVIGAARGRRWTSTLLVAELALTFVLLAAGGLLVRSSAVLSEDDHVVNLDQIFTARVAVPASRYGSEQQRQRLHRAIEDRLAGAASLSSVALSSARPFVDSTRWELRSEGSGTERDRAPVVEAIGVGPGYFDTLGLPITQGRALVADDARRGNEAVVVNERFVQVHVPGGNPIGRRIHLAEAGSRREAQGSWFTIVGVSPSVRQRPLSRPAPLVYLPLDAHSWSTLAITFRNDGGGGDAVTAVREAVRAVDPDIAVFNIESLRSLSAKSRWTASFLSLVITLFAIIALLLSAAGLYGVTTQAFGQRTSEIGLRIAVGATRLQIMSVLLKRTLACVAGGLALGLLGAIAIGRVIQGALIQSTRTDTSLLVGVALLLMVVVCAACVVPVRRAIRLDPVAALRHE